MSPPSPLKSEPKTGASSPTSLAEHGSSAEPEGKEDDTPSLLHAYFNLTHSLAALYAVWAAADPHFRRVTLSGDFDGVRILAQDPWEALVCFICSSNNNIARIAQMAHKLCVHYGPYLGEAGGEAFHGFPGPEALAGPGVEARLRELGFGYRARYIAETAQVVAHEKGAAWLTGQRNPAAGLAWWSSSSSSRPPGPSATTTTTPSDMDARHTPPPPSDDEEPVPSYRRAHEQLLLLPGVGPKVADCVCLMGLGWGEAVPVDTHVWQIAVRDYRFGGGGKSAGKTKTFSRAMYDAVGDHFRKLWGDQAGWAHSVLFTADLRAFAPPKGPGKGEVAKSDKAGDADPVERAEVVKTEEREEPRAMGDKMVSRAEAVKTEGHEESGVMADKMASRKRKTAVAVVKVDGAAGKAAVPAATAEISGTRRSKRLRTKA